MMALEKLEWRRRVVSGGGARGAARATVKRRRRLASLANHSFIGAVDDKVKTK